MGHVFNATIKHYCNKLCVSFRLCIVSKSWNLKPNRVKYSRVWFGSVYVRYNKKENKWKATSRGKRFASQRGHSESNQGPLDLQSNALPLSYTPSHTALSENLNTYLYISLWAIPGLPSYGKRTRDWYQELYIICREYFLFALLMHLSRAPMLD